MAVKYNFYGGEMMIRNIVYRNLDSMIEQVDKDTEWEIFCVCNSNSDAAFTAKILGDASYGYFYAYMNYNGELTSF